MYFFSILLVFVFVQINKIPYIIWLEKILSTSTAITDIDLLKIIHLHWLQNCEMYPGLHALRQIPLIW